MTSEDEEKSSNASTTVNEPEIRDAQEFDVDAEPSIEDELRLNAIKRAFAKAAFADLDQSQELQIARQRLLESSSVFDSMIRVSLPRFLMLSQCCYEGSVANLERLNQDPFRLSAHACINNFDSNGLAPVHYAAKYNKFSCLKMLVEKFGANVTLHDMKVNASPLSHCAKSQDKRVRAVAGTSTEIQLPKGFDWQEQDLDVPLKPIGLSIKKENFDHPYAPIIPLYSYPEFPPVDGDFAPYIDFHRKNIEQIRKEMQKLNEKGDCFHGVARYLIDQGSDINEVDEAGDCALSYASTRGNFRIVQELIVHKETNIDIELYGKGARPLDLAVQNGHFETVLLLLAFGARVKNDPETLFSACKSGNSMVFVAVLAQILMEATENLDEDGDYEYAYGMEIKRYLNMKDSEDKYIIFYATESKAVDIIRFISRFTTWYYEMDDECWITCANHLIRSNQIDFFCSMVDGDMFSVRSLIKCGTSNIVAAHVACQVGSIKALESIHKWQVPIMDPFWLTDEDNIRMKPLDYAVENGRIECVEYVINILAPKQYLNIFSGDIEDRSCFVNAIRGGNLKCVQIIYDWATNADAGYALKNSDSKGKSPVHYAVLGDNPEILKFLLENKFSAHKLEERDALSPLALAAKLGKLEMMEYLIKMRAEGEEQTPFKPNIDGNTPLHLAVLEGHYNCVKKLVEAYPSLVSILNGDSMSPLECATANGKLRIVKVLLKAGADPLNRSTEMPNALMYAAYYGQATILDYLLKNVEDVRTDLKVVKQVSPHIPSGYTVLRIAIERKNDNFRLLMHTMPKMALLAMDKSIINWHGSHPDSKDLLLRFEFFLLDDSFNPSMKELRTYTYYDAKTATIKEKIAWFFQNRIKQTVIDMVRAFYRKLLPQVRQYEKTQEKLDRCALYHKEYTADSQELLDNHPMTRMAETEDEDLLSHPLANAFIQQKWKRYGFKYYVANFILYIIFVILLSNFILSHEPTFRFLTYYGFESGCQKLIATNVNAYYGLHRLIDKILLLFVCSLCIAKEFWQFFNNGFGYLTDWDNYVELTIYGLTYFIAWDFDQCATLTGLRTDLQWQLSAVCLFLAWFNIILFGRNLPGYGHYIIMFLKVTQTTVVFLSLFTLFIIAYGLSFVTVFGNHIPFMTIGRSLIKSFVMMTGELDFGPTFIDRRSDPTPENLVFYEEISYFLYLSFLLSMCVIMKNLLVGLAVNDISQLLKTASIKQACLMNDLSLRAENMMTSELKWIFHENFIDYQPNKPLDGFWANTMDGITKKIFPIHLPERSKLYKSDPSMVKTFDDGDKVEIAIRELDVRVDRYQSESSILNSKLKNLIGRLEKYRQKDESLITMRKISSVVKEIKKKHDSDEDKESSSDDDTEL
ncbi:hypothetical protein Ciccas_008869 [Cichlidogyrus casuarinus]|uniref:Ion transport domain-containing protein n=1 Tax=Cichlidogyrus casuarinus TaxID=1844966 RepID=A0ABD2PZM2_9PLAT